MNPNDAMLRKHFVKLLPKEKSLQIQTYKRSVDNLTKVLHLFAHMEFWFWNIVILDFKSAPKSAFFDE